MPTPTLSLSLGETTLELRDGAWELANCKADVFMNEARQLKDENYNLRAQLADATKKYEALSLANDERILKAQEQLINTVRELKEKCEALEMQVSSAKAKEQWQMIKLAEERLMREEAELKRDEYHKELMTSYEAITHLRDHYSQLKSGSSRR